MLEKIWNTIKEALPYIVVILLVFSVVDSCNINRRFDKQLDAIDGYIGSLEQSIQSVNTGLREQKSTIDTIRENQSRVEQSIDELTTLTGESTRILKELSESESNVDGDAGAIYSSIQQLESIISTTLAGIEAEGIQ